jgi:hypothetical protein
MPLLAVQHGLQDGSSFIFHVNRISGKLQSETSKYCGHIIIDNVLHLGGWNLSIINQVFTSIHDLDVIDTYLPLKTLHESNRYVLVREAII